MANYKYLEISLYDRDFFGDDGFPWKGVVAYDADKFPSGFSNSEDYFNGDERTTFRVLKVNAMSDALPNYEFGDFFGFDPSDRSRSVIVNKEITEKDGALYTECVESNEMFDEYHENANWVVNGSRYSEEPQYYPWDDKKMYPYYDCVEEQEWTLTPRFLAAITGKKPSLDAAEAWLISEHPDYYMGASIRQDCRSGDFLMCAVPCLDYGEGNYETIEARRNYVSELAVRKGLDDPYKANDEKELEING